MKDELFKARSEQSILKEIEEIRDRNKDFKGYISDLGGPTANMHRLSCKDPNIEKHCRKLSCVYPAFAKILIPIINH